MEQFTCVQSDLRCCVHGVVCCLPKCGLKDRDACQLSQEPMRDAEQVQDGAQLEHGEVLRACACEHSVSHELCCDHHGSSPPSFVA